MNERETPWLPPEVDRLRQLYAEGQRAKEIAKVLKGRNRKMIQAKICRLKLVPSRQVPVQERLENVPEWLSDEADALIGRRYNAGHTDLMIATELGVTKGMVIGRRHRIFGSGAADERIVMQAERLRRRSPKVSDFYQGAKPIWRTEQADDVFTLLWNGHVRSDDIDEYFNIGRNTSRDARIRLHLAPRGPVPVTAPSGRTCQWKTPEGDAEFKRRWESGQRSEEILVFFGISRTTLKTQRLELGLKSRTSADVVRSPRAPRETPVIPVVAPQKKLTERSMMASGRSQSSFGTRALGIFENLPKLAPHRAGQCRWPLMCDAPAVGRWCAEHAGLLGKRAA